MPFEVVYIFGDQLGAYQTLLIDDFWQGIVSPLDVIVNHIAWKCTSNAYRHLELRQLILCIGLSCQMRQIHQLQNMFGQG